LISLKRFYLFFLFHQRKYEEVLKLTTFKISKDINKINTHDLRYQAVSSFYKDNFYHSKMCFEILLEKNEAIASDCNYLAYIYSRHNEREKAISTWCKALDINRNNKIAKTCLEYIRVNAKEINFSDDEFFEKNLPKPPFLIPLKFIFRFFIILTILSVAGIFSYKFVPQFIKENFGKNLKSRKELNKVFLPDYNPNLLEKPKEEGNKFSFSEKEIKEKFNLIKTYIFDEKAVEAQININQIKLSNASGIVKAKVDMLGSFINQPDYATFKNVVTFNDFIKDKKLYDKVYISWEGRVVNHSLYKDKIAFDFVIGNETKGTIDAIIPVVFNKAIIVDNNQKVKVFGQIVTTDNIYIEGKFLIKEKK